MRQLTAVLGFSVLISGCNAFYVPASPHVPLLSEKNDVCVNGALGASGFYGAGSYAFMNHFYCGGAVHLMYADYNKQLSGGPHIGFFLEPDSGMFHIDLQSGIGFGNSNYADQLAGDLSGNAVYYDPYLQASCAFRLGQSGLTSLGICGQMRYAYLKYDHRLNQSASLDYILPSEHAFASGSLFLQAGFKNNPNLKFSIIAGYQAAIPKITDPDVGGYLNGNLYLPVICHIGFTYQFRAGRKSS